MIKDIKRADMLTVEDLRRHPVWRFTNAHEAALDETAMRPVRKLPVKRLADTVIGTKLRFANGMRVWATLCNIFEDDAERTEQLLTVSIAHGDGWFHLARYFGAGKARHGPHALARALKLRLTDVFPISYDIRAIAKGDPAVLKGCIPRQPRQKLSRRQLMQLALK
jgi:hypothetical protein